MAVLIGEFGGYPRFSWATKFDASLSADGAKIQAMDHIGLS